MATPKVVSYEKWSELGNEGSYYKGTQMVKCLDCGTILLKKVDHHSAWKASHGLIGFYCDTCSTKRIRKIK